MITPIKGNLGTTSWDDFEKVELRIGTILEVLVFPLKQIANFISEFLITGITEQNGEIVLIAGRRACF
jgi:tRNA-binding protein